MLEDRLREQLLMNMCAGHYMGYDSASRSAIADGSLLSDEHGYTADYGMPGSMYDYHGFPYAYRTAAYDDFRTGFGGRDSPEE